MGKIIKSISIKNFRGIKDININFDNLNLLIGDNGTNKTAILEAINYAFSPSFLSGRIKSTDFYKGTNEPINIEVEFANNFQVELPDGYTTQKVECNKISLIIKKRERKSPGKILSDLVTIDHIVIPNLELKEDEKGNSYWSIDRKKGNEFKFNNRLLSFNVFQSEEIPRSFYFNKERDKQLQKGFNTSFSSVLEDLNWRYAKNMNDESNNDLFININETEQKITNLVNVDSYDIMKQFNDRVKKFKLEPVKFSFINKSAPFEQVILSKNLDKINLPIKFLGSGIEMIYSLLFLDALASLSKEKLIILIDEPELHLHPVLQEKLANYLYDLSKDEKYQIFITTHSPVFFKYLVNKTDVKAMIAMKKDSDFEIVDYKQKKSLFPWGPTWGEINFFAYDYPTIEFHNELYGYLQEINEKGSCSEFDKFLNTKHNICQGKIWIEEKNGKPVSKYNVTLMTFIRHKVHHPENKSMKNENYSLEELRESINNMIEIINKKN